MRIPTILKTSIVVFTCCFIAVMACKKDEPQPAPSQPTHPYGAGMGKRSFYISSDLGLGAITCYIDGQQVGTISHYHDNPSCGSTDVNIIRSSGSHSFYARSANGNVTWQTNVDFVEDQCHLFELTYSGSPGGTGQAMFWIQQDHGCGNISVQVNGLYGTISSYYSSGAPACGSSGCATFTLSPGTYSFTASCSGKNWNGTITVTQGGCSTMRLNA